MDFSHPFSPLSHSLEKQQLKGPHSGLLGPDGNWVSAAKPGKRHWDKGSFGQEKMKNDTREATISDPGTLKCPQALYYWWLSQHHGSPFFLLLSLSLALRALP